MKLRPDSILASLTEEQRDQLYDWLLSHTYPEVQKLAAKSLEEGGFDLKIHRTIGVVAPLLTFDVAQQRKRHAECLLTLN